MRRRVVVVIAAAAMALTTLTACPQPDSCGRKEISRYNSDGTVDHCKNGEWIREK